MKKRFLFFACACLLLCACSIKKHTVTNTEQNTSDFRLQTSLQTKVLIDSVLQSVDFSADSVIILVTPSATSVVEADSMQPSDYSAHTAFSLNSPPSIRITAHNPHLKSEKQKTNLVVTQQTEQDSVATKTNANSHADVSKDTIGVAKPMNGTIVAVIGILAVLIIATIVILLVLRKYKII